MITTSVSENKQLLIPKYFIRVLILLIILLGICILASLAFGSRTIGWNELMTGLFQPDVQSMKQMLYAKELLELYLVFCVVLH